jgi:hypothetical protein
VVTSDPAVALAARALLVPTPPRECDHRARYHGWNLDERWGISQERMEWNGEAYENTATPGVRQKGDRPVMALVGTGQAAAACAVNFVTDAGGDDAIVGANVVVGTGAPVLALVEGMSSAGVAVVNEAETGAFAVPSIALSSGKLIVMAEGTPFTAVQAAVEKAMKAKVSSAA